MITSDLGNGFYLRLRQLHRDYAPFWELRERRRFWFDKLHAWSEDDEMLKARCRAIKYNRARQIEAKHGEASQ